MTTSTLRSSVPSTLARITSCLLVASLFLAITSPSVTASPVRLRLSLSKRSSLKAEGQPKLAFNKRVTDADAAAYSAGIPDAGSWYESALAAGQASQAAAAAATPSALNNNLLAQSANAAPSQAMLAGSPDVNAAAYSAGIPAAGDWYNQQLAAAAASSPAAATPAPTPASESVAAAQPSSMVAPLNAVAVAPLRNGVLMQQVPSSDNSVDAANIWKNAMAANAQF